MLLPHYESTIYKISVSLNTTENIECVWRYSGKIFSRFVQHVSKDDIEKEKCNYSGVGDRGNEGIFYHEKIGNSIFKTSFRRYKADIRKDKKHLESYFRKWYTTGNALCVIVGDINTSATEKKDHKPI